MPGDSSSVIRRKISITKGRLTRLAQRVNELIRRSGDVSDTTHLQANVDEFRKLKMQYAEEINNFLVSIDETSDTYVDTEEKYLSDLSEVTTNLMLFDGVLKRWYRQLESDDDSR